MTLTELSKKINISTFRIRNVNNFLKENNLPPIYIGGNYTSFVKMETKAVKKICKIYNKNYIKRGGRKDENQKIRLEKINKKTLEDIKRLFEVKCS